MTLPAPSAVAELLKPITWFPPMWAFGCGVVASGQSLDGKWGLVIGGVRLAGAAVCATRQAVNDWFDRHVDAISEPLRPIPSGRMPGRWGPWRFGLQHGFYRRSLDVRGRCLVGIPRHDSRRPGSARFPSHRPQEGRAQ